MEDTVDETREMSGPKVRPSVRFFLEWVKRKVEEAKEHKRDPNEWYVTDLVRCALKREIELVLPPELTTLLWISPQVIHGTIVHQGAELLMQGKPEVEKSRQVGPYVVKGRADVLDEERGEVVEIKTVRPNVKSLPFEHHVLQLRAYMWLFGVPRGRLVYITHEWIREFEVTTPLADEDVLRLIEDRRSPRYDWECDYCPYKSFCPLGGRK